MNFMNNLPNLQNHTKISQLVNSSRLNESIALLRSAFSRLTDVTQFQNKLDGIETTYTYLLSYVAEGKEDPSRESMLDEIKESLLNLNDFMLMHSLLIDSSDSFSANKRMETLNKTTLKDLIRSYKEFNRKNEASSQTAINDRITGEQFKVLNQIFNHVWTIFGNYDGEYSEISSLLYDESTPDSVKSIIISALLLGSTSYYDVNTLSILLNAYDSNQSVDIRSRLIVAISLINLIHAERIRKNVELTSRLKLMTGDQEFKQLLNFTFLEIIRAFDTKRVTDKMRNEVIPGLMKINPEIIDKIRNLASDSEDFLSDSNPEWEEIIETSGVQDKIEEINKMQMDGSDVMMTTFSNLKGFPFFRDISNWFLPFYPEHPAISDNDSLIAGIDPSYLNIMMCDSDIYSFLLSIKSFPENRKELMLKNMQQQISQLEEIINSSIDKNQKSLIERKIRHYVRDIYRFFNLYSKKQDFKNPFHKPVESNSLKDLSDYFGIESDTIMKAAEFYFKYGYYQEASDLFVYADILNPGDYVIWEKIGFCLDKCSNFSEAIDWYRRAELFDSGSKWLEKKLAIDLKNIGNHKEALVYYDRLLEKDPENYHILMSAGQCQLEIKNYDEALQNFYHAEYLNPEKKDAKRAIAWTLLVKKDFEKASSAYKKLTNDENAGNLDFINAALCAMAISDFPMALEYYSTFLDRTNNDFRALQIALRDDSSVIKELQISSKNLRLVIDALRYRRIKLD